MIQATSFSKTFKSVCFCCGQQGHAVPDCKFKSARCYSCQKVGHLVRVCLPKNSKKIPRQGSGRNQDVRQLQDCSGNSDESSTEEFLHSVFQLGKTNPKFIITAFINGVRVGMEADSGAEWLTIPWSVFQDKLINVCKLVPSSVKLHQCDQSPLTVKGECKVTIRVNKCIMEATLMVVTCYPLFGRDWMLLLGLDLTALINEAAQIHNVKAGTFF